MPAAISICLKPSDRRKLHRIQREYAGRAAALRSTVILMSVEGASVDLITRTTGLAPCTIPLIRHRFVRRGIPGLFDRPRSGRPPRGDGAYRKLLRRTAVKSPRAYGYLFLTWSAARLAAHLKEETGVALSPSQVRRILKKEHFIYGRPKHTLRGKRDETAHRRAKKRLSRSKKRPSSPMPISSSGTKTRPNVISIPISRGAGD